MPKEAREWLKTAANQNLKANLDVIEQSIDEKKIVTIPQFDRLTWIYPFLEGLFHIEIHERYQEVKERVKKQLE
jgi:hypothetical protein